MIAAVVFDIGKVLVDWDPERFFDTHIGPARRKQLFAEVPLHAMNIGLDNGDPWLASVTGLADDYPQWRDEVMCWYSHWSDMIGPPIARTVRLMQALRGRGIPVYALTNFGGESYRFAQTLFPFFNDFTGAAVSGDLRTMKPDTPIYEHIEQISGLSGPALLFTDDKAENIATAAARGWQTHLFTTPGPFADRLIAEGLLTAEQAQ